MIEVEHGHRTVRGVRPIHVYHMRDALAESPGKANNWLSVFKGLMKTAMRLDLRTDNPAASVSILPIGEHEPWPADLLHVCLDEATPMTRLAIMTGLLLGPAHQRCNPHKVWLDQRRHHAILPEEKATKRRYQGCGRSDALTLA